MKESKYKIKIVCGFRKEQEFTINANEAHKAYYLFNNPEKRGTFNNGLAVKGSDIQRIEPDYNATMGWNHTHQLTSDDWNELHANGVMQKMQGIMASAKEIARVGESQDFITPLVDLVKNKYQAIAERGGSSYAQQLLSNKAHTPVDSV
jgi:predicted enzyme related to lactoylglutathione lyase